MFAVVGVAIILLGATAAFGYATWESGDSTAVENEVFQPADDTLVELNNSNQANTLYSETVTVTDVNDTTVFQPDGNYTWHDGNGTLFVEAGSDLANESDAHITYEYSSTTAEAFGFMQMFAKFTDFGYTFIYILVAAAVVAAARVFGGAG